MTNSPLFFRKIRLSLPIAVMLSVAAWQVMMPADKAVAQAVPAGELPPGEGNPADQVLPGQSLGSNLSLNQGVNAINAENQSFDRFGLGLSASGGEQTNFLGTQTNQQMASYAQFMADGGVLLRSERTRYFLLYQPQYNVYPELFAVEQFFPDRVPEHDPHPDGAIGDRVGHNRGTLFESEPVFAAEPGYRRYRSGGADAGNAIASRQF